MTLPTTGNISMSQIHAEFGYGQKLSDYVGKKWYKADGTEGTFSNPIKLSDFYGTSKIILLFKRTITISSNDSTSFVVTRRCVNLGWDTYTPLDITVNVNAKQSTFSDEDFLYTAPAGSKLTINIGAGGKLLGRGGGGGAPGGRIFGARGGSGYSGGVALTITKMLTTVTNNGVIAGGGGGGGGGTGTTSGGADGAGYFGGGGGGGAGFPVGVGYFSVGPAGADGTETTGGNGGTNEGGGSANGGKGGARGATGSAGGGAQGGTGGVAGAAVYGNNRITWSKVGTIYGTRINN